MKLDILKQRVAVDRDYAERRLKAVGCRTRNPAERHVVRGPNDDYAFDAPCTITHATTVLL